MFRRLQATKDGYITNKIVDLIRRERANVGSASTIDMFKLSGINTSGSASGAVDLIELSRGLIKFDLDELRALTGSVLDFTNPTFKCEVSMQDVFGGQPTPSNFTLALLPVSRSWDEGIGNDVVLYNDIDSANFITASSVAGVTTTWFVSGANKQGLLGSDDIDVILSGDLGDGLGVQDLAVSQTFALGTENLSMDVTQLVSATLAGQIPDEGFRLSFVQGEEDDDKTRFIKRFAARHASDRTVRPRLIVKFDDTTQDNQLNSFFDLTNTVFLYNYDRDGLSNLASGSAQTPITGADSLVMRLVTDTPAVLPSGGLFNLVVTASQHTVAGVSVTGTYSASFNLLSTDAELSARLAISESIDFTQVWGSLDATVGYLTQSKYTIKKQDRRTSNRTQRNFMMNITNMRPRYNLTDRARLRLFVQPLDDEDVASSKIPFERDSEIFHKSFYSIRDAFSNDVIVRSRQNRTRPACRPMARGCTSISS